MNARAMKLVIFVEFVLAASLLGGAAFKYVSKPDDPEKRPLTPWTPNSETRRPDLGFLVQLPLDLAYALDRPLFREDRAKFVPHPPVPPPQPAAQPSVMAPPQPIPAGDTSQFVLKGVVLGLPEEAALVISPQMPNGEWLEVGAKLSGWTLSKIDKNFVEITFNGQSKELLLYVDNIAKTIGSN